MGKSMMAAVFFLGIFMLAPIFGLQAAGKETTHGVSTSAHELGAISQCYVSSDGDCGGKTPCHSKIQDAIDAASDGAVILVRQGTYQESIRLTSDKTVRIKGGYDAAYSQQTPNTTFIQGISQTSIQASGGSLIFQMLSIRLQPPIWKNSLGMTFVLLPAGTFTMGSPSDEPGRWSNEGPQHQVTLSQAFYMQQTEVTQAQWEAVMGSNPSYFSGCPTCPVEQVSWNDAQNFIAAMNARGEGTYGLPTEAQWEYGARAGSTTAFYNGGITELYRGYDPNLNAIGWYCYNAESETHAVAQKTPNAWGLYDVSGNVWEWCQDWYGSYSSSPLVDPTGPSTGSYRVIRGGSWYYVALSCRAANRYYDFPGSRGYVMGFRLVLSSGQQ